MVRYVRCCGASQAVYALDLVAMMAGGRFQTVANAFVEAMEADALVKSEPASSARSAQPPSARRSTGLPSERVRPSGPCLKRAKRDGSTNVGIRRIQMPPLDVFQKEYMETATPVILSGVSLLLHWPMLIRLRYPRWFGDPLMVTRPINWKGADIA